MARFRTVYLTERQLVVLLDLTYSCLKELKRDGEINYTPDARYALDDLVEFLMANPGYAAAARGQDKRQRDRRLYEVV